MYFANSIGLVMVWPSRWWPRRHANTASLARRFKYARACSMVLMSCELVNMMFPCKDTGDIACTPKGPKPLVLLTCFQCHEQLTCLSLHEADERHVLQRGGVSDMTTNVVHRDLCEGHDGLRVTQVRHLHTERAEALGVTQRSQRSDRDHRGVQSTRPCSHAASAQ